MKTDFKKNYVNYGRVDWKLEFPKSYEEIEKSNDEDLIKWFRFLPGSNVPYKNSLNIAVKRELFKRYNPKPQKTIQ